MQVFATVREAKEYLIDQLLVDASRQNIELSEVERKMLYFSETGWTLPDIDEVSRTFDRYCNQDEYELKIGELAHRCFDHLRRTDPSAYKTMMQAERVLKREDHYLCVLINYDGVFGEPGPPIPWWLDRLRLILTAGAILAAILGSLALYMTIFGLR